MNTLQMNLLSLMAQVGFAEVSKEQLKAEIEKNFTVKQELETSIDTLLSIEEKYAELESKANGDIEALKDMHQELGNQIIELDMTEVEAISTLMSLEAERNVVESKIQASSRVITALKDKKNAELVAELPTTFQLGLKSINQSFLLTGQMAQLVNKFNIKLLTEVLSEIDKEMKRIDHHMDRVAKEAGAANLTVNGVKIDTDRGYYTTMAFEMEEVLNNRM